MKAAQRLARVVREGRLRSVMRQRLLALVSWQRERRIRAALGQTCPRPRRLPAFYWRGDRVSPESQLLRRCFESAQTQGGLLPPEVRSLDGMSGQKFRSFINSLVASCPDARYLEIGSWTGSTVSAALAGNKARALCIDNWSLFGGPREQFFANVANVLTEHIDFQIREQDFRTVEYHALGSFNIYMFDGPHEEDDQYDGVVLAQPALADPHFLIVDDWNWRAVRNGTFRALLSTGCHVECSVEVRTTLNNEHPLVSGRESDWHNGYFIAVVRKGPLPPAAPRAIKMPAEPAVRREAG